MVISERDIAPRWCFGNILLVNIYPKTRNGNAMGNVTLDGIVQAGNTQYGKDLKHYVKTRMQIGTSVRRRMATANSWHVARGRLGMTSVPPVRLKVQTAVWRLWQKSWNKAPAALGPGTSVASTFEDRNMAKPYGKPWWQNMAEPYGEPWYWELHDQCDLDSKLDSKLEAQYGQDLKHGNQLRSRTRDKYGEIVKRATIYLRGYYIRLIRRI